MSTDRRVPSSFPRSHRRVIALLAGGMLLGLSGAAAGAQEGPDADGLAGATSCTAQGAQAVSGVTFSLDHGSGADQLDQLGPLDGAGTLTMSWDGIAPGCEDLTIGLTAHRLNAVSGFDPTIDQPQVASKTCGADTAAGRCGATGSVSIKLGSVLDDVPCVQLDAHVGPPLQVVGPSGGYYAYEQQIDRLLSAVTIGEEPCEVESPTPTSTTEATPGTPSVAPVTTMGAPAMPPSITPTTTPVPASAPATTIPPAATPIAVPTAAQLPVTGTPSRDLAVAGAAFAAVGTLGLGLSRALSRSGRS